MVHSGEVITFSWTTYGSLDRRPFECNVILSVTDSFEVSELMDEFKRLVNYSIFSPYRFAKFLEIIGHVEIYNDGNDIKDFKFSKCGQIEEDE